MKLGPAFTSRCSPSGWQGHPVSTKNWHFIMPAEVNKSWALWVGGLVAFRASSALAAVSQ